MGIHEAAATGFGRAAAAYERGRPEYPRPAIDWLVGRLRLGAGRTVADVAAGTGKLSRPLAATGAEVVAIEPVEQMRALIGPGIRAFPGRAEELPLADASVDAVTVAQAFHWFDGDAALAEFDRVLRPGGALALVWNRRRQEDPIHVAIDRVIGPLRGDAPRHADERWLEAFERSDRFGPHEERAFPNSQLLDADGLADRLGSISYVASLPDADREHALAQLRALAPDGPVELRYRTEVQVWPRLG